MVAPYQGSCMHQLTKGVPFQGASCACTGPDWLVGLTYKLLTELWSSQSIQLSLIVETLEQSRLCVTNFCGIA